MHNHAELLETLQNNYEDLWESKEQQSAMGCPSALALRAAIVLERLLAAEEVVEQLIEVEAGLLLHLLREAQLHVAEHVEGDTAVLAGPADDLANQLPAEELRYDAVLALEVALLPLFALYL